MRSNYHTVDYLASDVSGLDPFDAGPLVWMLVYIGVCW